MDSETTETEVIEEQTKRIYVFGGIDDCTAETIIVDLLETDFKEENIKTIDFYICSNGGLLGGCFAIIDFLLELKKEKGITINTYALGEIASGGFFFFIIGDKRKLYPSCKIFVHEHITCNDESKTYGERLKADKTIEKDLYELYVNYTVSQLGISRQKAKSLLAKNKWLTAKEIATYNILGNKND